MGMALSLGILYGIREGSMSSDNWDMQSYPGSDLVTFDSPSDTRETPKAEDVGVDRNHQDDWPEQTDPDWY